jgi:3-hydroxyisobutyryl-CoA hydrolase
MEQLAYPKEQPGDEPDDVLFNHIYAARTIQLNRPKKLNSLNGSMARKIIPRLLVRSDIATHTDRVANA